MRWFTNRKPVHEESFSRVACLFTRENEQTGFKEVLYVRSPDGKMFFIPGARRIEVPQESEDYKAKQDYQDKLVLMQKMQLDLTVDLVFETIQKYTSFAAPAFGKEEGTMVENHYFFAEYKGRLRETPQIYQLEWRSYDFGRTSSEVEVEKHFTDLDMALMEQLQREGILNSNYR